MNLIEKIKNQYDALLELLSQVNAEVEAVQPVEAADLSFLEDIKGKLRTEEIRLEALERKLEDQISKSEEALDSTTDALGHVSELLQSIEDVLDSQPA
jgi:vacuolar-type H+-ATPase subunit I/STV1